MKKKQGFSRLTRVSSMVVLLMMLFSIFTPLVFAAEKVYAGRSLEYYSLLTSKRENVSIADNKTATITTVLVRDKDGQYLLGGGNANWGLRSKGYKLGTLSSLSQHHFDVLKRTGANETNIRVIDTTSPIVPIIEDTYALITYQILLRTVKLDLTGNQLDFKTDEEILNKKEAANYLAYGMNSDGAPILTLKLSSNITSLTVDEYLLFRNAEGADQIFLLHPGLVDQVSAKEAWEEMIVTTDTWLENVAAQVKEEEDDQVVAGVQKQLKKVNWKGLKTDYDKWSYSMIDYLLNGEESKIQNTLGRDVPLRVDSSSYDRAISRDMFSFTRQIHSVTANTTITIGGYGPTTPPNVRWGYLDAEEDLRLRSMYYLWCNYGKINEEEKASSTVKFMQYPFTKSAELELGQGEIGIVEGRSKVTWEGKIFTDASQGEAPKSASVVKEDAIKVVKDTQNRPQVNFTLATAMHDYSSIIKYKAAKMYGFSPESGDSAAIGSSDYLDSLTPSLEESIIHGKAIRFSMSVPAMTNMTQIASTSYVGEGDSAVNVGLTAYVEMYYLLLLADRYAIDVTGSTVLSADGVTGASGKLSIAAIDEFIDEYGGEDAETVFIPKAARTIIRNIIEICEGFDYLGVEYWTPELEKLHEYYPDIVRYKDNETIKAYITPEGQPLRAFFNVSDSRSLELSEDFIIGAALSSTYLPMTDNLYTPTSYRALEDLEWIDRFHYKYGFNRKALYIDTNASAAIDNYVKSSKGATRVAKLEDLMKYENDVVLYLDTSFYNVDKLAELQNVTYNRARNTAEAGNETAGGDVAEMFGNLFDTSIESVVKTGANYRYNIKVANASIQYGEDPSWFKNLISLGKNNATLSAEEIDEYLDRDEYSPLLGFSVVSSIYRHLDLFNALDGAIVSDKPVFVSSENLANLDAVSKQDFNTIYNYTYLRNLDKLLTVDYKSRLDLTEPIYMDLYGNICTESGLVVIPTAANATLNKSAVFSIYNTAFLSTYSDPDSFHLNKKVIRDDKNLLEWFEYDEELEYYILKPITADGNYIDVYGSNLSDRSTMSTLHTMYRNSIDNNAFYAETMAYHITEVLRGAPIEHIDKMKEGLEGNTSLKRSSIKFAVKIDEMVDQFLSTEAGNSALSIPDPTFIPNFEYVVVYVFKIIFTLALVAMVFGVYIDASSGKLGIATIYKYTACIILVVLTVSFVPTAMSFSYYGTNRLLLKNEAQYVNLLHQEKRSLGKEIGVLSIDPYKSKTDLYLKIDDVTIPWYKHITSVLTSSAIDTVGTVYDAAYAASPLAGLEGVVRKGDSLYLSVNYLMDSSIVDYRVDRRSINQIILEEPHASWITPYYIIQDRLLYGINEYNMTNNITSFATRIQDNGEVKTIGLISPYFKSNEFMDEGEDVLGMRSMYNINTFLAAPGLLSTNDVAAIENSLWYNPDAEDIEEKTYALDAFARDYVARNRSMLGKVSDDTFIKCMSLAIAVEHNKQFNVGSASSVDIMALDNTDLMRLSIANPTTVMNRSSESFARFVFEETSTPGIIATILTIVVYAVSGVVKPLVMFAILLAMLFVAIRMVLAAANKKLVLEGYFTTLFLLCSVNVLYGLTFKLTLMLPKLGVTGTVSMFAQFVLQILYMFALIFVVVSVFKDLNHVGMNSYINTFNSITKRQTISADRADISIKNSDTRAGKGPKKKGISKIAISSDATANDVYDALNDKRIIDWRIKMRLAKKYKTSEEDVKDRTISPFLNPAHWMGQHNKRAAPIVLYMIAVAVPLLIWGLLLLPALPGFLDATTFLILLVYAIRLGMIMIGKENEKVAQYLEIYRGVKSGPELVEIIDVDSDGIVEYANGTIAAMFVGYTKTFMDDSQLESKMEIFIDLISKYTFDIHCINVSDIDILNTVLPNLDVYKTEKHIVERAGFYREQQNKINSNSMLFKLVFVVKTMNTEYPEFSSFVRGVGNSEVPAAVFNDFRVANFGEVQQVISDDLGIDIDLDRMLVNKHSNENFGDSKVMYATNTNEYVVNTDDIMEENDNGS